MVVRGCDAALYSMAIADFPPVLICSDNKSCTYRRGYLFIFQDMLERKVDRPVGCGGFFNLRWRTVVKVECVIDDCDVVFGRFVLILLYKKG